MSASDPLPFLLSSKPSRIAAPDAGVPGILKKVAGMSPAKMAVKETPKTMASPATGFM